MAGDPALYCNSSSIVITGWTLDHQHQSPLGTWWKYTWDHLIPDLLNQRLCRGRQMPTLSAWLSSKSIKGFPDSSVGKESACNAGDLGSIPGLGRSPGQGKGYSFQYSGLENSMDCIVHGATESDTTEWLSQVALCLLVGVMICCPTCLHEFGWKSMTVRALCILELMALIHEFTAISSLV